MRHPIVSVGFLLGLVGCTDRHLSFLNPQGPVAAAQRSHLLEVVGLVSIVVLPVLVIVPLLVWRYRYQGSESPYRPHWSFSWPVEFVIWGVPVAIVAALATLLWQSVHALDPYKPMASDLAPLRIEVVGYDWKWLFIYPDQGLATVGELAFPDDRPLALDLTSASVMQSFFIPALGSQIYAMGGMRTKLHLKADGPGTYLGENTQYSGMGFQHQTFDARAMAPDDFAAWVAAMRAQAVPLDARTYAVLAEQNTTGELKAQLMDGAPARPVDDPPSRVPRPGSVVAFSDVPVDLFGAVVQATMDGASPQQTFAAAEAGTGNVPMPPMEGMKP